MFDDTAVRRGGPGLDLVLDIGKTRSKLLVLDAQGQVVAQQDHASRVRQDGAWTALDTAATADWLQHTLAGLGGLRRDLGRVVVSAHGAAFAAIDPDAPADAVLQAGHGGLAWPVPDYEFGGFDERAPDWARQIGDFDETHSPDLPRGLNAATQFDWLERHAPAVFARGQLLPLPQYWAWWLSGVAASEVSSLGCHTHLWAPGRDDFSPLAHRRGWAARFAPLRRAWETLGPLRPALAQRLGLPRDLRVHAGAHDSNACLARYLRSHPHMTLVTTGTWIVVMAAGAPGRGLSAALDQLSNVSVRREPVPTARFKGGSELLQLCAGADPALANAADLDRLVHRGVMALPGFDALGGPFRQRTGQVVDAASEVALAALTPAERASLAALYCAQVTAWLIDHLGGASPLIVEGPFARNPVYAGVLATLMPQEPLLLSTDALEGTARGAWMLSHWTRPGISAPLTGQAQALGGPALRELHARWCARVGDPLVAEATA
ncbi:MAG TPA: L-fuculose kinase [Burkholderiaceae bacterium]|nr:L-fuculose kinase [Burkholderiaceae bacterium]